MFRACLLWLLFAASIFAAPAPPPKIRPNTFRPGFVFRYWNYVLEIYRVDGELIYFQSHRYKSRGFSGNPMTAAELRKLLRECPQDLTEGQ